MQVANAFSANPAKVTSTEYLLFTQSAPGGAWQDAVEPYLLSGAGAPQVAVGADGLATAVSADAANARGRARPAPRGDRRVARRHRRRAVADPGNLADRGDQRFWQGKVPAARSPTRTRPRPAPTGRSSPCGPPTAARSSSTPTPPRSPSPRRPARRST